MYLSASARFDGDVDRFVVVIVFIAVMSEHLSTMTVDVGKHVMRICHTDYDQHTGNDYCLIVVLNQIGNSRLFDLIQKKQLQSEWEREGEKNAPPATKVSWHFYCFYSFFKEKKVTTEILTSHCAAASA